MSNVNIKKQYFTWLCEQIFDSEHPRIKYSYLLERLYNTDFYWIIANDSNRAEDGIYLRNDFAYDNDIPDYVVSHELNPRCSMLEMMVALSRRCEDSIMHNDIYGNRTSKWFWSMIRCMGLEDMINPCYDEVVTAYCIKNVLERRYEPDGSGGLFRCEYGHRDMRYIEIWYQMMLYLESIEED